MAAIAQTAPDPSMRRSLAPAWILAALAAVLFGTLAYLRQQPGALRGDEGTYVAMAQSLARDGDLTFDGRDAAWARGRPGRPASLILERTPKGVAYSKPILYPLLASPFVRMAGDAGLRVFNLLALALALALAGSALARRERGEAAVPTVLLFAFASTVVPYLAWRMTEALQVALATAGLSLALARELGDGVPRDGRLARLVDSARAPWAGMALLGLLAAVREPNALVALVPVVASLAARRVRRALALLAVAALAYGAVAATSVALTGAPNPYKSIRATFNDATGYPAPDEPQAVARFDSQSNLATSSLRIAPTLEPVRTLYAALYFWVGRHSGFLVYFPAALALFAAALAGSDRTGRAALAGFAAAFVFYVVYWPSNYFGGDTAIGNRYILAAYPCLLFVPRRLPSPRTRALTWLVAALVGGSALFAVGRAAALDRSSQSHTTGGVFRWLPYESTASNIEGRRDRYWMDDFVRFVDPFARVDETSFVLTAGRPGAELEIATSWAGTPLQLLALSDSPDASLVISDWLGSRRIRLAPRPGGSGGAIAWSPSPAWRVHPFWWRPEPDYRVRLVRLRLETASDAPVTARLRYLGRRGVPDGPFSRRVVELDLPESATAGASAELGAEVENRCSWAWSSDDPLPVFLAATWTALDPGAGESREFRGAIEGRVNPGGRARGRVVVEWPQRPGRYRVRFDLVLEGVAWFAERGGEPLADYEITVTPEPGAPEPAADPAPRRP